MKKLAIILPIAMGLLALVMSAQAHARDCRHDYDHYARHYDKHRVYNDQHSGRYQYHRGHGCDKQAYKQNQRHHKYARRYVGHDGHRYDRRHRSYHDNRHAYRHGNDDRRYGIHRLERDRSRDHQHMDRVRLGDRGGWMRSDWQHDRMNPGRQRNGRVSIRRGDRQRRISQR